MDDYDQTGTSPQNYKNQYHEIVQEIGDRLEHMLKHSPLNANRIVQITSMKPETLYKIRAGHQLPSCATVIKVKQAFTEINLNW